MKTVGSLLLLTFLILGFQNCSNGANFTSAGDLVAKGEDNNSDVTPDDGDGGSGGGGGGGGVTPPPNSGGGGGGGTTPPTGGGKKKHKRCDSGHGGNANPDHDNEALAYTCVLKGTAKFNRIGLQAKGGGAIRNVCMTENACLKILNAKFEVRKAEKSAACPGNNSSTIAMSDADIKASLAEAEFTQSLQGSLRTNR